MHLQNEKPLFSIKSLTSPPPFSNMFLYNCTLIVADSADATATPTCPTNADGAGYYAPTGLCYSVFKTKVTYSAAASACGGAYGAGNTGQLALLKTSAINDFVLDVVMSVPGAAHNWFGLSRPTTTCKPFPVSFSLGVFYNRG